MRDPVKSLVECGVGDDVETVIVDGRDLHAGSDHRGSDVGELLKAAQLVGERTWAHWQDWDTLHRTADEMCPMSFPMQ